MSADNEQQDMEKPKRTRTPKPVSETDAPEVEAGKAVKAVCLRKCQHNTALVNKGDVVVFAGGIPESKRHLFREID